MSNKNLIQANKAKKDEFYTMYEDIEKELIHYKSHFENKVVYCNCDNYKHSNFYKYFKDNFNELKLKKVITTCYPQGYKVEYSGEENITQLKCNGDFRNDECIEILKECDIVVTNPPFSLFREYVNQLMEYSKKFIIIGNENAITYKEFFPLLKDNKVWIGVNHVHNFIEDNGEMKKFGNICWYTNLFHNKRNKFIKLDKKYTAENYPKYDNYDAIEVSKVKDIPCDYDSVMGVPITFLDKYCPEQFEILDARNYTKNNELKEKTTLLIKDKDGTINGKPKYARILIRKKD